eukprot:CAMPEP_0177153320 /NCGR_PEP_ID=MMETSP0367-20130122/1009_1 /TAXON_ID=447022 ORGANISM="Scrippsiella hangoei-like, Strain SHHI-4" /NCGR_SAMPLE_ID=MMETSP0367 /ASSEMBLY_ACC=CAM_ASM_000362 /LENGTH=40 /DNA_ID= /DNA_START= /DNA_END= /DNA_ORIENTATION=
MTDHEEALRPRPPTPGRLLAQHCRNVRSLQQRCSKHAPAG